MLWIPAKSIRGNGSWITNVLTGIVCSLTSMRRLIHPNHLLDE